MFWFRTGFAQERLSAQKIGKLHKYPGIFVFLKTQTFFLENYINHPSLKPLRLDQLVRLRHGWRFIPPFQEQ